MIKSITKSLDQLMLGRQAKFEKIFKTSLIDTLEILSSNNKSLKKTNSDSCFAFGKEFDYKLSNKSFTNGISISIKHKSTIDLLRIEKHPFFIGHLNFHENGTLLIGEFRLPILFYCQLVLIIATIAISTYFGILYWSIIVKNWILSSMLMLPALNATYIFYLIHLDLKIINLEIEKAFTSKT
jgi:hypothetical protein